MKHALEVLALCAVLGVAVAGCQDSQSSSAAAPSAVTATASASGQAAAVAVHPDTPVAFSLEGPAS